jgi:hypothetical protein
MGSRNAFFTPGGRDWAGQQLRDAGWGTDEDGVVVWFTNRVLDSVVTLQGVTDDNIDKALPIITELINGRALTEEHWSPAKRAAEADKYHWIPVSPRQLNRDDVVRVKADAYNGEMGIAHNGRVGRVADIRNGVIVAYDGVAGMGSRHDIEHLEQRIDA